jgi:dolichol-phosphate mannosyltransferase
VAIASRLLFPLRAPRGFTSLAVIVIFFGAFNLVAISLIGEYIAKIFEEVKGRPHFIRRDFIREGQIRRALEGANVSFLQRRHGD